jgi:hypothetical protein
MVGVSPVKVLRELEKQINHGELEEVSDLIDKLPMEELKKLVKTGLKHGKLVSYIDKMEKEELQELVYLCSLPKNLLVILNFIEGLDAKRKRCLLS